MSPALNDACVDPLVRFGQPTVDGVSTERLRELFDVGETVDDVIDVR